MNKETKLRIEENSAEILRHVENGTMPEYSQKRGDSTVAMYQAIEILKQIKNNSMTAYQIAEALRISSQTVFQYIGAMEEGGIAIKRNQADVIKRTGRPETIF